MNLLPAVHKWICLMKRKESRNTPATTFETIAHTNGFFIKALWRIKYSILKIHTKCDYFKWFFILFMKEIFIDLNKMWKLWLNVKRKIYLQVYIGDWHWNQIIEKINMFDNYDIRASTWKPKTLTINRN